MEEIFCKVCYKNYDHLNVVPRVISGCGHTMCSECITAIMRTKFGLSFKCPFCNNVQYLRSLNAKEFPKNYEIVDLLSDRHNSDHCTIHNHPRHSVRIEGKAKICPQCLHSGSYGDFGQTVMSGPLRPVIPVFKYYLNRRVIAYLLGAVIAILTIHSVISGNNSEHYGPLFHKLNYHRLKEKEEILEREIYTISKNQNKVIRKLSEIESQLQNYKNRTYTQDIDTIRENLVIFIENLPLTDKLKEMKSSESLEELIENKRFEGVRKEVYNVKEFIKDDILNYLQKIHALQQHYYAKSTTIDDVDESMESENKNYFRETQPNKKFFKQEIFQIEKS